MKIFITGTDTDVGKTYVTLALLNAFKKQGLSTLALKPVASGNCQKIDGQLYNNDALALQRASTIQLEYNQINPFAFAPPIAPHIAATLVNRELSIAALNMHLQFALNHSSDICLIEGAGGWHTPLNDHETLSDWVKVKKFPIILVVGMRLGCLNHALLTMNALTSHQIPICGWIANEIDPHMLYLKENILTLQKILSTPFLGSVQYQEQRPSLELTTILRAIKK